MVTTSNWTSVNRRSPFNSSTACRSFPPTRKLSKRCKTLMGAPLRRTPAGVLIRGAIMALGQVEHRRLKHMMRTGDRDERREHELGESSLQAAWPEGPTVGTEHPHTAVPKLLYHLTDRVLRDMKSGCQLDRPAPDDPQQVAQAETAGWGQDQKSSRPNHRFYALQHPERITYVFPQIVADHYVKIIHGVQADVRAG